MLFKVVKTLFSFSFNRFDRGKSRHSQQGHQKFLQMANWLLKADDTDVGDCSRHADDPEDEVDHQGVVELHGVAGQGEVVVNDNPVYEIDAVAESGQGQPGSPGQKDVDWTSQTFLAGEDDPGH